MYIVLCQIKSKANVYLVSKILIFCLFSSEPKLTKCLFQFHVHFQSCPSLSSQGHYFTNFWHKSASALKNKTKLNTVLEKRWWMGGSEREAGQSSEALQLWGSCLWYKRESEMSLPASLAKFKEVCFEVYTWF